MSGLPSVSDFPPAGRDDWLRLVDKVLNGATYDRRLVARTQDGLRLDALTGRAVGRASVAGRSGGVPWTVTARVDMPDTSAANAQALADLEGGASGLGLVFDGATTARGFGLPGTETLNAALEGVSLDLIETRVEAPPFDAGRSALAVMTHVQGRRLDPATVHLHAGLDPLSDAAATGGFPLSPDAISESVSGFARRYLTDGFKGTVLTADARVHHEAGAGAVQELAAGLATALAYLRMLDGFPAHLVGMAFAVDHDQFETIAKLRAARLLWAALLRECGLADAPLRLHAETSWRMMARRDPHVNMLRTTIAAFAAGAGGADSLCVLPFTQALGLPDGFARRMARNTQTILIEEANIHRVADPGAGSGAIEAFTDALAEQAWELFRRIEAHGGMAEVLASGWWAGEIAPVRARRMDDVATRKAPLTGVSHYPLPAERDAAVLVPMPVIPKPQGETAFAPLVSHRLAEPFEALREAAERHSRAPAVFLATLGSRAAFAPRAAFATDLFAAGGLAVSGGETYRNVEELTEAFRASGARLACLCGTDEAYGDMGADAAHALLEAGGEVWLAGHLTDPERLALAGVSHTIFTGCDAIAALRRAQEITFGRGDHE